MISSTAGVCVTRGGLTLIRSEIPAKRVRLDASFVLALPVDFFSRRSAELMDAISHIFADRLETLSPELLYQSCAEVVSQGLEEALLEAFSRRWRSEISSFFRKMEQEGLGEIPRNFRLLTERRRQVRSVFMPLDRKFVLKKFPTLDQVMVTLSREQFPGSFASSVLAVDLREISGEISDLLAFLRELSLYESFVSRFLASLRSHLTSLRAEISGNSLGNLADKIEKILFCEQNRPLDADTLRTARKSVLEILVAPFLEEALQQGSLVEISDHQFSLIREWSAEIGAEAAFSASLARNLSEIFSAEQTVGKIDALRSSLTTRLTAVLPHAGKFVKEALESRLRGDEVAKQLAREIDRILRTSDTEELSMSSLFKYLGSKDVFEHEHRKFFGRRLLQGVEKASDTEIVGLMKKECGGNFVNKLETMLKDKQVSTEISGRNFQVFVLTTGVWPSVAAPRGGIRWPGEISDQMELFGKKYSEKFQHRSLAWLDSAGSCVLKYNGERKKEISGSVRQGVVLLLFNERLEISAQEISDLTKLEHVRTLLDSLQRSGAVEAAGERWKVGNFSSDVRKIQLLEEKAEENEETQRAREEISDQRLREERMHSVDAAMVRIMKNRKVLSLNALFEEIGNFLAFPVSSVDLKKRVEGLIEREFLERDAADHAKLHYLA